MSNTYSRIYVQIVFSVKYRKALIDESFREELQKYINGIIINRGCKLCAVYANPDHVHILIRLHPNRSVSNLVRDIKSNTSKYINEKGFVPFRFQWQKGYGVFSYSASQLDVVVKYIQNQPEHHRKRDFRAEYIDILQKSGLDYDERFLFD